MNAATQTSEERKSKLHGSAGKILAKMIIGVLEQSRSMKFDNLISVLSVDDVVAMAMHLDDGHQKAFLDLILDHYARVAQQDISNDMADLKARHFAKGAAVVVKAAWSIAKESVVDRLVSEVLMKLTYSQIEAVSSRLPARHRGWLLDLMEASVARQAKAKGVTFPEGVLQ